MADDEGVYGLARAFFLAATKMSDDSEDILPQEVGSHCIFIRSKHIFIRLPLFLFLVCMLPLNSRVLCEQDSEEMTISVFGVFSGLFQEAVGANGAGGESSLLSLSAALRLKG